MSAHAGLRNTSRAARPHWSLLMLAFVVLAAIVGLRKAEPGYADKLSPLAVPGVQKQWISGRNFKVRAAGLQVAHAYVLPGDDLAPAPRTLGSAGVWLSVVADVVALREPGYMSAQLRTRDGLVYPASSADRPKLPGINLAERELAPALQEGGAWFFELPPDRLQGAHLQVYWGNLTPGRMDSLVDIDLGIDAARARSLLAAAPPTLDLRQ